jgi:hypothetical protein
MSSSNLEDFCSVSYLILSHMIKRFSANKLFLNLDKTNIMKFVTKTASHSIYCILVKRSVHIQEKVNTKFLGGTNDSCVGLSVLCH